MSEVKYERPEVFAVAKSVELGAGISALASQTTLRGSLLELTLPGVFATSKKNGRCVFIPWANVKGCEVIDPNTKEIPLPKNPQPISNATRQPGRRTNAPIAALPPKSGAV